MRIILSSILLFIITFSSIAQVHNDDVQAITATIKNYFDGYIERDINKLNKAFDIVNGTMKIPTTTANGSQQFENAFFKDLMPKWAAREKLPASTLENCALKILNMDIVEGKIGIAKISMKVGDTTYIDILSLQKLKDMWKITNKIYIILEK